MSTAEQTASTPGDGEEALRQPVLELEDIVVEFPASHGGTVHAVSGVSFEVFDGEAFGLVGESGCGKSTTARAIVQIQRLTSGSIVFEEQNLTSLSGNALRRVRPKIQMVFQDPMTSLNPRRSVFDAVAQPLRIWKVEAKEVDETVRTVLSDVGLDPDLVAERYPHELSGGQAQRVSIARALVLKPHIIICDEPVSALDVSVQAQILNLLRRLRDEYGLTLVFIAHDLAVVKNISDRIGVMYLGKMCELASSEALYRNPRHPYTAALIDSVPVVGRVETEHRRLEGELPSPLDPPSGCRFRTRCPRATDRCATEEPQMVELEPGHQVACHHPLDRTEQLFPLDV